MTQSVPDQGAVGGQTEVQGLVIARGWGGVGVGGGGGGRGGSVVIL